MGTKIPQEKLSEMRQSAQLRGIRNETEWVQKLLKWDLCTDTNFKYVVRKEIGGERKRREEGNLRRDVRGERKGKKRGIEMGEELIVV